MLVFRFSLFVIVLSCCPIVSFVFPLRLWERVRKNNGSKVGKRKVAKKTNKQQNTNTPLKMPDECELVVFGEVP